MPKTQAMEQSSNTHDMVELCGRIIMAPARLRPSTGPARSDDDMKDLLDLFSRNPTPVRVTMHVERLDTLRESLLEGIALTEKSAADIDPASKAEARQAAAVVASMRTAYQATEATGLVPA